MEIRHKIKDFTIPKCNYVIIDTDAGGDDCQAIVLAISEARRTGKTILGITCVDGNAFLDDVTKNVLIAVSICGADIPIFKGSRISLMGPTRKDNYFSTDGLGLQQAKYIKKLESQNRLKRQLIQDKLAADFIVESANKYQNDLAIIGIGPLGNIALAYHFDNSISNKIGLISLMGGTNTVFGIRQFYCTQFNFFLDWEATKIVLDTFPRIYLSTFDLSFDLGTKNSIHLFTETKREKAKFIHDIHSVILQTHRPSVCDPLALIPVFSPEIIDSLYEAYAEIETTGLRTRGAITFNWLGKQEIPEKHKVRSIVSIDLGKFMQLIDKSYD